MCPPHLNPQCQRSYHMTLGYRRGSIGQRGWPTAPAILGVSWLPQELSREMSFCVCSCSVWEAPWWRAAGPRQWPLILLFFNELFILWLWRSNPAHDDQRRLWLSVCPWFVSGSPWVCRGQVCEWPYDGPCVGFWLTSLFSHLTTKEEIIGVFKVFTFQECTVQLGSFVLLPLFFSVWAHRDCVDQKGWWLTSNPSAAETGRLSYLLKLRLAFSLLHFQLSLCSFGD